MFDREYLPFWLACIALVLSFLLMIALHAGSADSDVAAWVQAIGSIGAIVGAVLVVEHQHRLNVSLEERRLLERRREALAVALDILRELGGEAGGMIDEIIGRTGFIIGPIRVIPSIDVEGLVRVLCAIDPADMSDAKLRLELVRVQRRAELFMSFCKDMQGSLDLAPRVPRRTILQSLGGAKSAFASSISAFEDALANT